MSKLWGGRFSKKTDKAVEDFTRSIDFDYKLAEVDVIGSICHISILKEAKLITKEEWKILRKGLYEILDEIRSGRFKYDKRAEDIHSNIQTLLEKKIGKAALKLHTCRSRNDQVVFDIKMYCKYECLKINDSICDLQSGIWQFAESYKDIILPGYTHLQHAQVIRLEDYLYAYMDMFFRDAGRIEDALKRIKISLGSGALAGTPIEESAYKRGVMKARQDNLLGRILNEMRVDAESGGREIISSVENTVDNVSDRDFVIEILSALAILGMHLSRLSEDFILWSTKEFGFIEIGDEYCTGSSLMPQKKNPDVLELIRGNTGKLYGNLTAVLTMMKGLPLAYNRDMQLDKEPLFDSFEIVGQELKILAGLIPGIKINKDNIEKQLEDESLYATDLADYLVMKNVPFKEAHNIIGRLVSYSLEKDKKIKEMSDEELKRFSSYLNHKVVEEIFDPMHSVKSRKSVKS